MRKFILPYSMKSESVQRLKGAIEAKLIKLQNSHYMAKVGDIIVNWGNSTKEGFEGNNVLNKPSAVAVAVDKIDCLMELTRAGVPTLEFTTSTEEAAGWSRAGIKVFVRNTLNGHSGEGIEIIEPPTPSPVDPDIAELDRINTKFDLGIDMDDVRDVYASATPISMPSAPLYTKGKINHGEYRVHVFRGQVIDYRKKVRQEGREVTSTDVRTLGNGWVYQQDIRRLERIEQLAISTINSLGLDFGCVDIIMSTRVGASVGVANRDVYVLEVNTAPALGEDRTLEAYADAINNYITSLNG